MALSSLFLWNKLATFASATHKKMKLRPVIYIVFILSLSSAWASPQRSSRLSCQGVTSFAEDSLGFIWIGTERGLNRYDSEGYSQFFHSPTDSTSIPSNYITALFTDNKGTLWVGTNDGACFYDQEKACFRRVRSSARLGFVHQIWQGRQGVIYMNLIGAMCRIDQESGELRPVANDFDPAKEFSNHCHLDPEGNIWSVTPSFISLYTGDGASPLLRIETPLRVKYSKMLSSGILWLCGTGQTMAYDTRSRSFVPLPKGVAEDRMFKGSSVSLVHELRGGNLLIVTDRAFFIYAKDYDNLVPGVENSFPGGIPYSDFSCFFTDSGFDLWIGSRNHGMANIYGQDTPFNTNRYLHSFLRGTSVVSLDTLRDGMLVGTSSDGRIFRYDPLQRSIEWFKPGGNSKLDLSGMEITASGDDKLFLIAGEKLYDLKLEGHSSASIRPHNYIEEKVSTLAKGPEGRLWLGTAGSKIYSKEKGESRFRSTDLELPVPSIITDILPLEGGDLVIGLLAANPIYYDASSGSVMRIPVWVERPMADMVTDMIQDSHGEVWISTRSSGLFIFNPATGLSRKIHNLECEEIMAVEADRNGNIWIATLDGLARWSVSTEELRHFRAEDGLGGNQFNLKSATFTQDGLLLFGGTHGVTSIKLSFKPEYSTIPIYFESLRIGGEPISPGSRFDKDLPYSPEIRLGYKDNHFSVSYAALDYSGHGSTHYYYRLQGYQDQWTDNLNHTEVSFSNLKPGKYTLEVKTSPSDPEQEPSYASIPLRVTPAPWNSAWAWAMYIAVVLALAWVLYSNRIRILKEKEAAKRAELEKAQEKKVNEMNMSFFANISHEFRTPLTLISGPVVQLEKSNADAGLVRTIKWNVARMLRLVNQLMDFGKLEEDTLRLQVAPQDIVSLLRQTAGAFAWNMEQKNITFSSNGLVDSYTCPVDADKVDKIVSNLLSNAMKYTPAGGEIGAGFDVILPDEAKRIWEDAGKCKYLKITISDNGPKIPEASLERIFERYYQVENHHNWGTGIGLYFARRLAVLHHGWLRCDNLSGDGLVFTLLLPAEDIYTPEEKASEPAHVQLLFKPDEGSLDTRSATHHDKTVLLVDDDPGIVGYLRQLLQGRFNVRYAYDGKTALENALSDIPDLVISDVAMPGMDGYQLCRKIKDNTAICHIPVILVTAKTTKENQLEGLGTGADAYVTKPFDPDVLLAMVETLLRNRERVRGLLRSATSMEQVQEEASLSPQDSALMKDLYELMDKELTNQELNINSITDKLYISRTNLYYKIKALTGETPNAFFKNYKLSRAKQLLDSGKYNVSEVADMTGWSNATVFGRNFKGRFSMTPGEYLQSCKK